MDDTILQPHREASQDTEDHLFAVPLKWNCPSSRRLYHQSHAVDVPDLPHGAARGRAYRCPVCGFELELDESTDSLVLARLLDNDHPPSLVH